MNTSIAHTIVVVKYPRVILTWIKPNRTLGPGVYHFVGDHRCNIRTMSQRQDIQRGALDLFFEDGDTKEFLVRHLRRCQADIRDSVIRAEKNGRIPEPGVIHPLQVNLNFYANLARIHGVELALTPSGDITVAADPGSSEDSEISEDAGVPREDLVQVP
jgi:hypothetical protein